MWLLWCFLSKNYSNQGTDGKTQTCMPQGRLLWAIDVFLSLYVLLILGQFPPKILSLKNISHIINNEVLAKDLILQINLSIAF